MTVVITVDSLISLLENYFHYISFLQLALKTVNSSRSAFAYVLFSPAFFIKYQSRSPGDGLASGDDEEESFRCRITAKVNYYIDNYSGEKVLHYDYSYR